MRRTSVSTFPSRAGWVGRGCWGCCSSHSPGLCSAAHSIREKLRTSLSLPWLSQSHVVVVANSPYVVCAIITSMCKLRKPRLGLYQPVEKSGSDLSILDLEPLPHETPLQWSLKISSSKNWGPAQLTHLDCFLDHISRPVCSSIKEQS